MYIPETIKNIVQKLSHPDHLQLAEREFKNLIRTEIDDGEKLMIVIKCLSNYLVNRKNETSWHFNQVKLFIFIAEIFQSQIIEFLPSIFDELNKIILTGSLQLNSVVSDTYGGISEYCFVNGDPSLIKTTLIDLIENLKATYEKGNTNSASNRICSYRNWRKAVYGFCG